MHDIDFQFSMSYRWFNGNKNDIIVIVDFWSLHPTILFLMMMIKYATDLKVIRLYLVKRFIYKDGSSSRRSMTNAMESKQSENKFVYSIIYIYHFCVLKSILENNPLVPKTIPGH